ncbi:unnamed protein product [Porites evermanni]|uniref:DZIP3-like HEPN domain-containing protein n=1 Tax=Porites evermanni TaxID=104178 RepID=A0ABN8LAN8_9CNID|nr:unnamed protein product [Porites evermanni]
MACAAPATPSTKETTNYARLCRLLVELGTRALKDTFDSIHPPARLHAVLATNKTVLRSLRGKKIINPTQWGKLFPTNPFSVSSSSFDITLLMVLLRNICGLAAPTTGWDVLPTATDLSREANIARIKFFRNTVYAHARHASVDDTTFNSQWQDIRKSLVCLGGPQYRTAIDHLETECMDPETKQHYIEQLEQWKKDEDNVKIIVDKLKAKVVYIEAKVKEQTDLMQKSQEKICSAEKDMVEIVEEKIRLLNAHKRDMEMKFSEIREARQREYETRIKNFKMVATQTRKYIEKGEDFLKRMNGPGILETECAADLIRFEKGLNDEEMEIYKPRRVTYRADKDSLGHFITDISRHLIEPQSVSVLSDGKLFVRDWSDDCNQSSFSRWQKADTEHQSPQLC